MSSEYKDGVEERDRTWMVWVGLALVFCLMIGAMAFYTRGDAERSVVRARHILIAFQKGDSVAQERALKQITDLRARIVEGESFGSIARDYSQDPLSARRGGDLNYAPRGIYVDEFEAFVWTAPIGELSEIIETTHGYHLVVVEDRVVSEVDRVVMEQDRAVQEEVLRRQQEEDAQ